MATVRPAVAEDGSDSSTASNVVMPTTGRPPASARPRAAASATRMPVKDPGPTVTAILVRSPKPQPASAIAARIIGISRSAWPRLIGSRRRAAMRPPAHSAAEQQAPELSKARMVSPSFILPRTAVAPSLLSCIRRRP